jgi:PASTA domain-containing protein/Regulator of Chromosome Condensation (RCC1) repeat protein
MRRGREDNHSSDPVPISPWRGVSCSLSVGAKGGETKLLTRPRPPLRLCALALLSVGLLLAPGASPATAPGRPVAWGCGGGARYNFGQCRVPSGLSGVTAISAGTYHSLTLKGDGAVVAWGCGDSAAFGQCGVPSGRFGVTAISAGFAHSLALVGPITPASCRVPNVVGKRLAPAKRTIAQRHCRTGKVGHAYSRKRKKGIVISQSRRPGRVLPARSRINLTVSRGRKR